jgi:nucleoside-diphosphate-sugar epimerase
VADEVEWMEADVLDVPALEEAMHGVKKVYHSAAVVSFDSRQRDWMMQINVEGTANMVNLALDAGVEKFLHVSSISAFGRYAMKKPIDESTSWQKHPDNTNYAISKHLSEMEVWRGQAEGLNTVIINPSTILGAGDWRTGSCALFDKIGKGLKFYTTGLNGFVDVRDVVSVAIQLMESDISAERFIVSEGNYRFKDIFFAIADAMHKPRPSLEANPLLTGIAWRLEWLKSRLTGSEALITKETARYTQMDFEYKNDKVKAALGIEFKPVKQTIEETAPIYLQSLKEGKRFGTL